MSETSKLFKQLQPYIVEEIQKVRLRKQNGSGGGSASGGGGVITTHSIDGALHTGTLADSQAPQFLKSDGSRTLTGNLAVASGITIDGVDISALAATITDHGTLTGLADDDHAQYVHVGIARTIAAVHTFNPGSATAPFSLHANAQGQLVTGLRADQLNKSVIAGSGLTTGGVLTGDVTLAVGAGDGITVSGDDVAVNAAALVSGDFGLEVSSNDFRVKLASNGGLTIAGGLALSLASPSGLQLVSNELSLATPGTLSAGTSNVIGANHQHAVSASANPGAAESLLKSTGAGGLTLESLLVNGSATIGQTLLAGASGFRVLFHTHDYDHVHVVVNPGGFWNLDEQFGVDIDDNLLVRGWIVGKHAIQLPGATLIAHYDGAEPYETNFKGETTGHMGQVGTTANGVIFRPGKFGKAVQLARSNTNLIPNPSFEDDYATNYDQAGTITLSHSLTYTLYGTQSLRVQTNANNEGYGYICTGVTSAGATYRFSAYVRGVGTYRIVFNDNVSGDQVSGNVTLTNDWQRISHDATFGVGSTSRRVHILQVGAGTFDLFTDGWQLEAGTTLTPYADGSLGIGHTWSGTAHQSSSSRSGGALNYLADGVVHPAGGTIMAWVYREWGATARHDVIKITFSTTEKLELYQDTGSNWTCRAYNGATYMYALNAVAWTPDPGWHHLVVTWDANILTIYRDGVVWALDSGLSTGIAFDLANDLIHVGGQAAWDGLIDDLVIADRAVTADEVRAIYESNAPVFAETSTWHWRGGRNRVWADQEGMWIVNYAGSAVFGAYAGDEDGTGTKSWGGVTLASSDVLIGDNNRGGYVLWDDSTATMNVKGSIIIQAGSSGYASITDKPANLSAINSGEGTKLAGIATGATVGATWGTNLNSIPARFGDAPGAAGLYLTATHLGYYNGSAWKAWIASSGNFYFGGDSGAHLEWNGSHLRGLGTDGTTVQWYANSADGKLYAAGGVVRLDANGINLEAGNDAVGEPHGISWRRYGAANLDGYLVAFSEPGTSSMEMWTSIRSSSNSAYRWLFGGTEKMALDGDGDLSVFGTATISPTPTTAVGLTIAMPAGTSVAATDWQYNGATRAFTYFTSVLSQFGLVDADFDAGGGPSFVIGRNSDATTPAAGALRITNLGGTDYYIWPDASGNLRINTSVPNNAGDGGGVAVGAQTSMAEAKYIDENLSSMGEVLMRLRRVRMRYDALPTAAAPMAGRSSRG